MSFKFSSKVENSFYNLAGNYNISTKTPYLKVNNFPNLGLLTALRFLEWVAENPHGVVSLPTGKTPEYFIKYMLQILNNWESKNVRKLLQSHDIENLKKPKFNNLQFVQIDEFYPISPKQHNSFYNYVNHYYLDNFGIDKNKAQLINSDLIPLPRNLTYNDIFDNYNIDLTLRHRSAKSKKEELQQKAIFMIDNWCCEYEEKIRAKGGIGFFLGGIGPDGHIAFNVRGSSPHSVTRLTHTNFETQASSASDLGGIEISRNRLVITIGLGTITYNPDVTAIIFAAGDTKSTVVKNALENDRNIIFPGTSLQKSKNAVFYLTNSSASKLEHSVNEYYTASKWTKEKTIKAVFELAKRKNKYVMDLSLTDLKSDKYCKMIPNLSENTKLEVIEATKAKLDLGLKIHQSKTSYHTGPHHDDILLGILPYINRQLRHPNNKIHFAIMTSGFTAVTNDFLIEKLSDLLGFIQSGQINMLEYPNFFKEGYLMKKFKDVSYTLDAVAQRSEEDKKRGFAHRLTREIVDIFKIKNTDTLIGKINELISILNASYPGKIDDVNIQNLKGRMREFEEELVWGYYGVPSEKIHHLRLGFYKGSLFTEMPEKQRDMIPILEQLRKIQPDIISLAMDPEASGPDTHFKVLQAIAGAIKEWAKEKDLSNLKIIGYRNVWLKFALEEANMIVPVSLNSLAILQNTFSECYSSQVNASFPSYEYDGKFSDFTQKVWVEQMRDIQLILGKDFFINSSSPLLRATHGMIYIKNMTVNEFLKHADFLEKMIDNDVMHKYLM